MDCVLHAHFAVWKLLKPVLPFDYFDINNKISVLWLKQSVTSQSPQRPEFSPRPVHVGFVVDKVALGEVSKYFSFPT
jgi:hypothetical protein